MKADFFKKDCQESTSKIKFGLCDDDNKKPAYIDTADESRWIATVLNDVTKKVQFTAIDNCIDIIGINGEMTSRCDAMLTYDDNLFFVELKNKRANWKSEGLEQIESTIKRMIADAPEFYYYFKRRKAIVANSKHAFPAFRSYDTEQREYFIRKYKIHLQFEAEITIR